MNVKVGATLRPTSVTICCKIARTRPLGYKIIYMFNSFEICYPHNFQNKLLAFKIFEQEKFHAHVS